jgi:hypothetical protein
MGAYDNTLGAIFVGGFTTAVMYGVTCVQVFLFTRHDQNKGRVWYKTAVRISPGLRWDVCLPVATLCRSVHCG